MRKLKTALGSYILSAVLFLTGCADKGTLGQSDEGENNSEHSITTGETPDSGAEVKLSPITAVKESFDEEVDKIKSRKFDNISFADLKSYSFPNVSEITTYKAVSHELGGGLSPEQFFDNFAVYCNYLEPGKYTRDKIAEICWVFGNFDLDPNGAGGPLNYNDFVELNKDGDFLISHICILNPDLYLDYFGHSAPGWYSGGRIKKLLGIESDRDPAHYSIVDNEKHPIVRFTENVNSTDVYHLIDGDISIADAAKKANELLADMARQCDDGEYQREVCAVNVVDIDEGNYGYIFLITDVVDGIKYAYADARGSIGLGYGFSYAEENGNAGNADELEMVRSDELLSFHTTNGWKERTPVETYDSIVPLNIAAENVSALLSREMNFKAKSVTLVYDIKGGTDDLVPCWRFLLENTAKREQGYHVYVNALTGEARVKCIQDVDYSYEYD
ncbi:MAG: hypothetical protein HDR72_04150 [Ruminococcaceae bacterium]|nr:hypothetical protein [Oscillospiraceae bacterium]